MLHLALFTLLVGGICAATAEPQCYDIKGWTTLTRSGLTYGSGEWGGLTTNRRKPIAEIVPANASLPEYSANELGWAATPKELAAATLPEDSMLTALYSVSPDIPTFHTVGGKTYVVNHFEFPQPATLYISELAADGQGALKVVKTAAAEDAKVAGTWFTCSGTITPWGTHLGSEEYPPDCRLYEDFFVPCKAGTPEAMETMCGLGDTFDGQGIVEFARYFGYYNGASEFNLPAVDISGSRQAHAGFTRVFKCYNYGATPEVKVLEGGKTKVTKWRTIGRISHESAIVMPNNKTVYTTDDNPNGVLLKFEADRAGDLSSGVLYAAKLANQKALTGGRYRWTVSWIPLGRGNQAALDKLATSGLKFSDLFTVATPTADFKCPAGFLRSNTPIATYAVEDADGNKIYLECLKFKPGMKDVAAFFESRRVAAMLGATTEFEKKEGITYSDRFKQVYIAITRATAGMEDNAKDGLYDIGGTNDIRMEAGTCGHVMAMDVDDNYSGIAMQSLIIGSTNPAGVDEENKCDVRNIAGPDNLYYFAGNLIINEDTSLHLNNVAWAYNLEDGSLTRIISAPQKAEISGVYLNKAYGRAYLTEAIQHPLEGDGVPIDFTEASVEGQRGYMGYVGPIPAEITTDDYTLTFTGVRLATTPADKLAVYGTNRVCARPADKSLKKPFGYETP